MRVLLMAHLYPPAHNAGAEWMVHTMLRSLSGRGHDAHVLLSRAHPRVGDDYDLDGVHVHPARSKYEAWEHVGKADVVLSHLENSPRARLLAHEFGRPHIPVLHNDHRASRDSLDAWAAFGVVNSEWMQAAVAGDARCPLLVVRPPVLAGDYETTPGRCVTLVNLSAEKGAGVFYALAQRMPKVTFLGVRGAYGGQDLRDLPNVEILDHVPGHRMAGDVYARTRVLLVPSLYESWGRVAVEAMCSAIPVVAAPTPGLLEALGPAGAFADRDDLDSWEAHVRRLLTPRGWAAASAAARARAAELDPTDELTRWCEAVEAL